MIRATVIAILLLLSLATPVQAQEVPELIIPAELIDELIIPELIVEEVQPPLQEVPPAPIARPLTIPELIASAATRYGISAARMACIVHRESGGNPWAYNRQDGSMGLLQFQPRTWAWASWQAGVGGASPYDAAASVEAGAWLMSQPNGFRHWSVARFC